MTSCRRVPVQQAVDFNKVHWPPHNRRQGIDWKQEELALAAFDGDELTGVAIYKVVGGMAYLEQLVVREEYTRRGIGSSLLHAFEAHALELGCHVLQLETAETQAPDFYERHGYERLIVDMNALSGSRPWRHNIQYRAVRLSE